MSDRAFERITQDMGNVQHNATLGLSLTEMQVLAHLAEGHSVQETADHMGVAFETAKEQRKDTFARLGARNGPHAVAIGFRMGLLS